MPAYLIVNIKVLDAAAYQPYVAAAPAIVARCGGRYLVRGGAYEVLEGTPQVNRTVVLEFPSMQHIRDFYADPEYQRLLPVRLASTESQMFAIEGFVPPAS
jgi:uncharacterized protein (DUF1330 family)